MKSVALWYVVGSQVISSFVYADAKCTIDLETIEGKPAGFSLTFNDASCLDNYIKQKIADNIKAKADQAAVDQIKNSLEDKANITSVQDLERKKANIDDVVLNATYISDQKSVNSKIDNKAEKIDVANIKSSLGTKADITQLQDLDKQKANTEDVVLNSTYTDDKAHLEAELDKKADKETMPTTAQLMDNVYTGLSINMLPYMVKIINPDHCQDVEVGVPSPFEQGQAFSETLINEPVGDLLLAPIESRQDDTTHVGNIIFSKLNGNNINYLDSAVISIKVDPQSHLHPLLTCDGSTDFTNCQFKISKNIHVDKINEHTLQVMCS